MNIIKKLVMLLIGTICTALIFTWILGNAMLVAYYDLEVRQAAEVMIPFALMLLGALASTVLSAIVCCLAYLFWEEFLE